MREAGRARQQKSALPIRANVERSKTLIVIAIYKFVKVVLLTAAGFGLLHLLHRDVYDIVFRWLSALRVDPNNHYANLILEKALAVEPRQLRQFSIATFAYAALFLIEGLGIYGGRRWAEYLVIISTGSFMPLEIYEVYRHTTWIKVCALIINALIVAYLFWHVQKKRVR